MPKEIKTRYAPSPTGPLHLGAVRTAFFNYLFAKKNNGQFILRIEDTDKERSKKEYEDDIVNGLKWLKIDWAEFSRQSDRLGVYKKYLQKLVVDDFEAGITHVIRGEDHISNTPRQILIQRAIGAPLPAYAHLPLLLGKDRSKLSKRHGAESVSSYKEKGYIEEAVINFIALLGWHPVDEREILSIDEFADLFSIERVQKGGAICDFEKLNWFNREYIKRLSLDELAAIVKEYISSDYYSGKYDLNKILSLARERMNNFSEINDQFDFVIRLPSFEKDLLKWKGKGGFEEIKKRLGEVLEI